jgi:hypothetical protein
VEISKKCTIGQALKSTSTITPFLRDYRKQPFCFHNGFRPALFADQVRTRLVFKRRTAEVTVWVWSVTLDIPERIDIGKPASALV